MERTLHELVPDRASFTQHLGLVQAYVRHDVGSRAALMAAANSDPEGLTTSIVAMGAVLLDIAAGAFKLTPEQMLDKLAEGVAQLPDPTSAGPAL